MKKLITTALITIMASASALADDSSLIGYWNFDSEDKTQIISEINPQLWKNATVGSDVRILKEGQIGNSFEFVKNDNLKNPENYAILGCVPNEALENKAITFAAWIKPTGWKWYQNIFSLVNDQSPLMRMRFANNSYQPIVNEDSTLSYSLEQNKWYFVVNTIDYNTGFIFRSYVNGVDVGGRSIPSYNFGISNSTKIYAGSTLNTNGYTEDFNGLMDEVQIYNTALTQSEVTELFNSYKVDFFAGDNEISMGSYSTLSDNTFSLTLNSGRFNEDISLDGIAVKNLPQGLYIESVSLIDEKSIQISLGGEATTGITDDTSFLVTIHSNKVEGSCLDGDEVPIIIKKPNIFTLNLNAVINDDKLTIEGNVKNTWNTTKSSVVLLGVYDRGALVASKILNISELIPGDSLIINESFSTLGFINPTLRAFVWDSLPERSSSIVSGGKIMAEEFSFSEGE